MATRRSPLIATDRTPRGRFQPSTVTLDDLLALRRKGLSHRQIGEEVGLTRQAVAYRLSGIIRAHREPQSGSRVPSVSGSATWYPRAPEEPPARCPERDCARIVGRTNRAKGAASILPEPDFCRYCDRPLTERAIKGAPRDGFIAAANVSARRPANWSRNIVEAL